MKRADVVPNAARKVFIKVLKDLSVHAEGLPSPLPIGRVLFVRDENVVPEEVTRRGDLNTDEELRVLANKGEKGYFLDYYRIDNDNDGQTSSHGRIHEHGTLERLENFEGQWGRQVFPDDPAKTEAERQRILTNNERVREILRAKGFT